MIIHNLSARQRRIADLMWNCKTRAEWEHTRSCLSRQDQLAAAMIMDIAAQGGDDLADCDMAAARQIILKIMVDSQPLLNNG